MKKISLTQSCFALVDDADFEWLSKWKWYAHYDPTIKGYYVMRNVGGRPIYMHQEIAKADFGMEVDHVDRNPLNNQRSNLRIVTHSQNQINRSKQKNNTSGFRGVCKERNKWRAWVWVKGKKTNCGAFDTPEEAARAYDKTARDLHGDFAYQNFPLERQ